MKSIFFGAFSPDNVADNYAGIDSIPQQAAITTAYRMCTCKGTLHSFIGYINSLPTQGSWTFTIQIDGVDTALTATITTSISRIRVKDIKVRVNPGNKLTIKSVPTGTPTAGRAFRWSIIFESDIPKESPMLSSFGTYTLGTSNATQYNHLQGGTAWDTNESNVYNIMPTTGKIKNMYIELSAAPGAGKTRVFTLMVNSLAATDPVTGNPLSVTIAEANTTGSDTTNIISVTPGQTVSIREEGSGTPTACIPYWGTTFVAETDGEAIVMKTSTDLLSATATEYSRVTGPFGTWGTSVTANLVGSQPIIFKKFYVSLSGAAGPTGADGYTLDIWQVNAAISHIALTLLGATTSANDTTTTSWLTKSITADFEVDVFDYRSQIVGTPNTPFARLSFVRYLPPNMYSDYDLMLNLRMGKNGGRIPKTGNKSPFRVHRIR